MLLSGMDGWIRVWYYETIDHADPPEEDRFLEIEPIYEIQVKEENGSDTEDNSILMSIQKQYPEDPEDSFWYAQVSISSTIYPDFSFMDFFFYVQDGNGGLWLIDLGTFEETKQPRKFLTCHAGPITSMDVATWGPFVATCGEDGRLHIYNYLAKKLILVHKFRDKGSKVIWFPCSVNILHQSRIFCLQCLRYRLIKGFYILFCFYCEKKFNFLTSENTQNDEKSQRCKSILFIEININV